MAQYIYSIKDEAAGIFYEPIVADSDAVIRRDLEYSLANLREDAPVRIYPRDFTLYRIGLYDFRSGMISYAEHERICSIADLIKEISSDAD